MNELLKKYTDELIAFWTKLNKNQKILIISLVLTVSVGFIFLMNWIRQPQFEVLYSNLAAEDAGIIVDKLKESKVEYQLSKGGTTIEVPARQVYDLRIQLAKAGFPRKSETGYELFDRNKLGMSDFLQKLSYQRALEGELMRTIQQMNEIEVVRIHIVIPEPSLFEEDKKVPTASVLIKLTPGAKLNRHQIRGIGNLVSGSVEGLDPENINIIDFNGNILSSNQSQDTIAGLTNTQLELKKKVDGYLTIKLQSLFDNVLGLNNSVVRVDAELDFRKVDKTSEIFDPDNAPIRSEEIIQESTASETNQPNKVEHTTTNYEINKTIEHVLDTSGNIRRLSIAVLVNGIHKTEEDENGELIETYAPRSQEELSQLAEIAKNAIGFNEQRNDHITISDYPFDTSRQKRENEALETYKQKQLIISIVKKAALAIAVIIFLLYLRSFLNGLVKKIPEEPQPDLPEVPGDIPSSPTSTSEDEIHVVEDNFLKKERERIRMFAQENPQDMSRLIRTWLEEDKKE